MHLRAKARGFRRGARRAYRYRRGEGDHPLSARRSRRFYLSFDDGPDAGWTPRVLDELARLGVRASFFVSGERVRENPGLVGRIAAEGHDVELHCMRHLLHFHLTRETVAEDTDEALALLAEEGVHPNRWRPPFNRADWWTPAVAEERDLRLTGYSADPRDWTGQSAGAMLDEIRPSIRPGWVAIMHDAPGYGAPREDSSNTVELLEPLVHEVRRRGLEPAPLSEGRAFFWMVMTKPEAGALPGDPVSMEVVDEDDLTEPDRKAVRRLLGDHIQRDKHLYYERGWRTLRPEFRVLARVEGEIVGQGSCFALITDPPVHAHGTGDVVVHPAHRGSGLGFAIGRVLVRESGARQPLFRMGGTVAFAFLETMGGGRKVEPFEIWYESDGACRTSPTWWIWERDSDQRLPRLRLEHGSF